MAVSVLGLPGELERQQEHEGQRQDGGDDQLRTSPRVLVVDVIAGSAAGRAPAFHHRPGALSADQVFAAHRNPFRVARGLAVTAM
jgi:hypothetical protein